MKALLTALFLTLSLSQALAVMPDEVLSNSELEMRARTISKELRCMVCQNQSIDDSDAQLAKDLRVIVRERLTAGDSNSEVFEFVEARYGEFVLRQCSYNCALGQSFSYCSCRIGFDLAAQNRNHRACCADSGRRTTHREPA
jgi:cytochrome c-type biogenesis protein CcmH